MQDNPATAAWTQQDALNAPLDPKNANRYAYAGGDPINNQDPTGQSGFVDFFSEVSKTVGAGLGSIGSAAVVATCPESGPVCLEGSAR